MSESREHQADLKNVVDEQSNEIWDVIALIEGARERPFINKGDSGDRLLRIALAKLNAIQDAWTPYI